MVYWGEVKSEDFLKKEGFKIIDSAFVSNKLGLLNALKNVSGPYVMKVAGKNIVHKNKIGGIKKGIKSYANALLALDQLKLIKGSNGVLVQTKMQGSEYLLGLKRTPEFGEVIVFGSGGVDVEEKKDVSFRVCPVEKFDAYEMIGEVKATRKIEKAERDLIVLSILKLSKLGMKYPNIQELDINPLMVFGEEAKIVDARIVWN